MVNVYSSYILLCLSSGSNDMWFLKLGHILFISPQFIWHVLSWNQAIIHKLAPAAHGEPHREKNKCPDPHPYLSSQLTASTAMPIR